MKKGKSEGTQAFNVPATDEGKAFIKLLRRFANKPDCQIKVRGRGKRAVNGKSARHYASSIPISFSEWLAVYIRSLKNDTANTQRLQAEWKRYSIDKKRIEELEEQVKGLKIALVEGQERYNKLFGEKLAKIHGLPSFKPSDNPAIGTVTISVKGAHIKIVQEQE